MQLAAFVINEVPDEMPRSEIGALKVKLAEFLTGAPR